MVENPLIPFLIWRGAVAILGVSQSLRFPTFAIAFLEIRVL